MKVKLKRPDYLRNVYVKPDGSGTLTLEFIDKTLQDFKSEATLTPKQIKIILDSGFMVDDIVEPI